jgi:PKHD-type hydroxylase
MILCIDNVLLPDECQHILAALESAEFVDGTLSAGWYAQTVKHNVQLQCHTEVSRSLQDIVNTAIRRHPLFQMAVRPKVIRPPLFSRYDVGMFYGTHADNALMGDDPPLRSDVSLTLFLSDPSSYEGGELTLDTSLGPQKFKLPIGSMLVYPATMLHWVEPVRAGVRLAAVTWVQSLVRDIGDREILFDLDTVRRVLFEKYGKTDEFDLLSKTHANLLRKWIEV